MLAVRSRTRLAGKFHHSDYGRVEHLRAIDHTLIRDTRRRTYQEYQTGMGAGTVEIMGR